MKPQYSLPCPRTQPYIEWILVGGTYHGLVQQGGLPSLGQMEILWREIEQAATQGIESTVLFWLFDPDPAQEQALRRSHYLRLQRNLAVARRDRYGPRGHGLLLVQEWLRDRAPRGELNPLTLYGEAYYPYWELGRSLRSHIPRLCILPRAYYHYYVQSILCQA